MRISDGRSDVCSSDLVQGVKVTRPPAGLGSPCLYQSGSAVILRAMIGVFLPSVVKRSPTGHSASTNVPSSGSAASAIMRLAHRLVTASETLLAPARTTSVISTRRSEEHTSELQ